MLKREQIQLKMQAQKYSLEKNQSKYFVKGNKSYTLSELPTSASLIREVVAQVSCIPKDLLHITLEGRCLTSAVLSFLKPGSTLHYTVKAKGGMLSGAEDDPAAELIREDASETDVEVWLKQTCLLTEDKLAAFEFMDGKTLFLYKDFQSLMNHTGIEYGLARRILYLRDYPGERSILLKWSSEDVRANINKWLKRDLELKSFTDKNVDGVVFMSYKNAAELEQELCLSGVLANRIIAERGVFLAQEQSRQSGRLTEHPNGNVQSVNCVTATADKCEGINSASVSLASTTTVETSKDHIENGSRIFCLDEKDKYERYKMFVQDFLHLLPLNSKQLPQGLAFQVCDLKIICHKRKELNDLEDCFLFLLLCKSNFLTGTTFRAAIKKLWDLITDAVPIHWVKELPHDVQRAFIVENQRVLNLKKEEVAFDVVKNPIKVYSLPEYDETVQKLDHFCTKILLIDRQLLKDNAQGYCFKIGSRKDNCLYNFGFATLHSYWLFDSEDFGSGFEKTEIQESKAGLLQRWQFVCSTDSTKSPLAEKCEMIKNPITMDILADKSDNTSMECLINVDINDKGVTDRVSFDCDAKGEGEDVIEYLLAERSQNEGEASDSYKYVQSHSFENLPLGASNPKGKRKVSPRPFKEPKWQYDEGILNVIESGDGMMVPSVELKYHGSLPPNDNLAKRAFLKKSLEFVCGCLNSRQNGTIYFGVAEKDFKGKKFEYGEITGVELTQSLQSEYYDIFRTHMKCCFPQYFEKVNLCVQGPYFVHIRKSNPEKYVIEIDIEPSFNVCKDILFVFDHSSIIKSYGDVAKKDKQRDGTGIFRRTGSQTCYVEMRDKKDFEREILPELVKRRETQECHWNTHRHERLKSEAQKLRNFIAECDDSMYPILIISNQTLNVKENSIEYFKFIQHIRWAAVFDFDKDSEVNGVYSMYKSAPISNDVMEVIVKDFYDMSVDERREKLSFPRKTTWLFANGKSTGNNACEQLGLRQWKTKYLTFIQNAVSFYKDNSVIPPTRRLVLILVSTEMSEGILDTANYIVTAFGWDSVFFVFDCEQARSCFLDDSQLSLVIDDISSHSAVLPWRDVHCIISKTLNVDKKDRSKDICTASGAIVSILPNNWQSWTDLDILSSTECEDLSALSKVQEDRLIEREEMQFYNGRQVSWMNFYFPDQVMERACFSEITDLVKIKALNADNKEDGVPKVTIGHMPGTGGTTLGKHVLWGLRKKYKCAVITRISKDTELQVCEFWEAEEVLERQQLKPVILLVDNIAKNDSEPDGHELCRKLFIRQKKYQLLKPLAILIYCQRNVTPKGDFILTQKIEHPQERTWMTRKYEELEKKKKFFDSGIQTFLGFLSMRHEFDKKYLQNTMIPYLDHGDLQKQERDLIMYIALIMTYFPVSLGSPGIPVVSCDKLMQTFRGKWGKELPWEKNLSKVAKIILVVEDSHDIERKIVRIASCPYADAILRAIMSHDRLKLADIVIQCLQSCLVTENSYMSSHTKTVIKKMLIERQYTEIEDTITPMSPLIMDIKIESFRNAVDVLELGYEQLKDEVFYQQLARLYLDEKMFDAAAKFAKKAVDLCPRNGEFKHTLGMVYLKKFEVIEKKTTKESIGVGEHAEELDIAFRSLENFIEAQNTEDALAITYAYCGTVKIINLILKYAIDKVLSPEDLNEFGCFLTDEAYQMKDFDAFPVFKEKMKSLLSEVMKALCFLYYFGYSHKSRQGRNSVQTARLEFLVLYVKDISVRHFIMFARVLRNIVPNKACISNSVVDKMGGRHCLENIKLTGSFFESIFYKVLLYNHPDFNPHQKQKFQKETHSGKYVHKGKGKDVSKRCARDLEQMKANLDLITRMSITDMDSYVTVCLALELMEKETDFTINRGKIYKFCNRIIEAKDDPVRTMRAHLFRVLVNWPRKDCRVFVAEQFRMSFHHPPKFLLCKDEPLTPSVHFFLAKSSAKFHLCHWSEIFNPEDETENRNERMHQLLETFHGNLKAHEINGEIKNYILFDLGAGTDHVLENLKIKAVRGKKTYVDAQVKFYLGFSLQGPVAYISEEL